MYVCVCVCVCVCVYVLCVCVFVCVWPWWPRSLFFETKKYKWQFCTLCAYMCILDTHTHTHTHTLSPCILGFRLTLLRTLTSAPWATRTLATSTASLLAAQCSGVRWLCEWMRECVSEWVSVCVCVYVCVSLRSIYTYHN